MSSNKRDAEAGAGIVRVIRYLSDPDNFRREDLNKECAEEEFDFERVKARLSKSSRSLFAEKKRELMNKKAEGTRVEFAAHRERDEEVPNDAKTLRQFIESILGGSQGEAAFACFRDFRSMSYDDMVKAYKCYKGIPEKKKDGDDAK